MLRFIITFAALGISLFSLQYMPPLSTTKLKPSSPPGAGLVAGVVVGVVVVTLLAVASIVPSLRRYTRKRQNRPSKLPLLRQRDDIPRKSQTVEVEKAEPEYIRSGLDQLSTSTATDQEPPSTTLNVAAGQGVTEVISSGEPTSTQGPSDASSTLLSASLQENPAARTSYPRSAEPPDRTEQGVPPSVISSGPTSDPSRSWLPWATKYAPPITIPSHPHPPIPRQESIASFLSNGSTESLYSQPSASTHIHFPHSISPSSNSVLSPASNSALSPTSNATLSPTPLLPFAFLSPTAQQEPPDSTDPPLTRTDTRTISAWLKFRAQRSGVPSRTVTQVSRIERPGSIRSTTTPKPVRARSQRRPPMEPMEPLAEHPSASPLASPWSPTGHPPAPSLASPWSPTEQQPALTAAFASSVSGSSTASSSAASSSSRRAADTSAPQLQSSRSAHADFGTVAPLRLVKSERAVFGGEYRASEPAVV